MRGNTETFPNEKLPIRESTLLRNLVWLFLFSLSKRIPFLRSVSSFFLLLSLSPFKADLTLSPIAPSSRRPSAVRVRRLLLCRAQSAELLVTQWGENKEAGWEWDATSAGSIPTPKNSESILFGFFCQGIVKQNRFFTIKNHDTRFAVIG